MRDSTETAQFAIKPLNEEIVMNTVTKVEFRAASDSAGKYGA